MMFRVACLLASILGFLFSFHAKAGPLHEAAEAGSMETAWRLLGGGADADALDEDGRDALHYAAARGHKEMVRFLLSRGASPVHVADNGTALHWAAFWNRPEIARMLVEGGAVVDGRDTEGRTALHAAAATDAVDAAEQLVKSGADVNALADDGTPLHVAAFYANSRMVRTLLAHGADPKARDDVGATPLHAVAMHKERKPRDAAVAIVRMLVEGGAGRDARDHAGRTPLDVAGGSGYAEVARALAASVGE